MDTFSFDTFWDYVRRQPALFDGRPALQFQKGQDIFRQGEICSDIFVMTDGLVKLHYVTHDGKEWIKSFVMDAGMFGSRVSQSLGEPSTFSVTCIENCRVHPLPYAAFENLCTNDPKMAGMAFGFFQWLGLKKEQREHELLCRSAEERYQTFMESQAALAARITQVDMARYLGVTPIALSRIKSRLATA